MSFEVRAIAPDEIDALMLADQRGFGGAPPKPEDSRSWAEGELDRTRVAFESGRIVGVSRTYSFDLTMPGGSNVPAAAVSWVSVPPTDRRRGVLTRLMAAMHDDARERNEPAAILTASESSIYGRFGYGIAAWRLGVSARRADVAFAQPDNDRGRTRLVTRTEAEIALPAIYERVRGTRAGMVTRPDFWWPQVYWGEHMFGRYKASFVAIHADADGVDDGFVTYGIVDEWDRGVPEQRLSVIDMQAETPATWIHLWRYLFAMDLVATITATNVPVDDPLRHVVVDSRRVRVDFVNDHLWIAPFDPVALLAARTYTVPGRVVIQVHALDGTATTVSVDADAGGSRCTAVTDEPDLVCDAGVFGMCVLGGNRWSELAAADRVEVRNADALGRADAMFLASPAPALLSYF